VSTFFMPSHFFASGKIVNLITLPPLRNLIINDILELSNKTGWKKEHYPFSRDNGLRKFKWEGFSVIQLER
jgi:hypothetical protein